MISGNIRDSRKERSLAPPACFFNDGPYIVPVRHVVREEADPPFFDHTDPHAITFQELPAGKAVSHDRSQFVHMAMPGYAFDHQGIKLVDIRLGSQTGFNGHSPQDREDARDIYAVRASDAARGALQTCPEPRRRQHTLPLARDDVSDDPVGNDIHVPGRGASVCTAKTLVALRNGYPRHLFHLTEKKTLGHKISILTFF